MKKLVAILLGLMLVTVSMVAFADAPTSEQFTTQPLYSFENIEDRDYLYNQIGGEGSTDDGWMFYPDVANNYAILTVEGNKMVINDHYNGYVEMRVGIPSDMRLDAATSAEYDMIGFYIENNTTETAGVAFFGENADDTVTHQMAYQGTDFYDIESYLVDLDGNVYVANEYMDDYGHGLAELPAGFKGYYMVTLATCGHDYCSYGNWGFHQCETNGEWIPGTHYISAVGFGLYSLWADIGETFVIDDYFLAKKTDAFNAAEGTPGGSGGDTTDAPGDTTDAPDNTTDAPAGDTTDNAGQATDQPTQGSGEPAPQGMDTTTIIIIVAAVVAVIVVVVVVVAVSKKKKA